MKNKLLELFKTYEKQTSNTDIIKNDSWESLKTIKEIVNELSSNPDNMNLNLQSMIDSPGSYTAQLDWLTNFGEEVKEYGYIRSYKDAGDYLVNYSEETIADLMVYSVMFNYMQYTELLLKNIIRVNGVNPEKTHDLIRLWDVAKQYIKTEVTNAEFMIVDETIKLLFTNYSNSMNFRYKEDNNGNESIANNYEINLYALKTLMNILDYILFNTYGGE